MPCTCHTLLDEALFDYLRLSCVLAHERGVYFQENKALYSSGHGKDGLFARVLVAFHEEENAVAEGVGFCLEVEEEEGMLLFHEQYATTRSYIAL